jgi:cysteine desulfurase
MSLYYFDHAASAPRRDEVSEAMAPFQHGVVGNPSGMHKAAREARRVIEDARDQIAAFVGAAPGQVVFTGGGTESCHMAIAGAANAYRRAHGTAHLITSAIEHHAVMDCVTTLQRDYPTLTHDELGVDGDGVIRLDELARLVKAETAVVSVMNANNETGVIQPLHALAQTLREINPEIVTHTDAVAAAPWLDLAESTKEIDLVSLCAHKIGGPVNAGALIIRRALPFDAIIPGGGQERGQRGGTVDVAAAVGLACATQLISRERAQAISKVTAFQRQLGDALAAIPGCFVTAPSANKLPGTVHVTFEGIASDELLFLLDHAGICASAAASCSSGAAKPSHVLDAMGVSDARARGSLRLSMGIETTQAEVDYVIANVARIATQLTSA